MKKNILKFLKIFKKKDIKMEKTKLEQLGHSVLLKHFKNDEKQLESALKTLEVLELDEFQTLFNINQVEETIEDMKKEDEEVVEDKTSEKEDNEDRELTEDERKELASKVKDEESKKDEENKDTKKDEPKREKPLGFL